MTMKTTLPLLIRFPPPAPGTDILMSFNRPGAGRAADTGITAVVQNVVGNLVRFDVAPNVLEGPIRQRIDLDATLFIRLKNLELRAVRRLFPPKSGNPGSFSCQGPTQGFELTDRTA